MHSFHVRSKSSKVHEKVSDLKLTVADEENEQQQPSDLRPEGFCCSVMVILAVRRNACTTTARSPSNPLDGQCMLTAALDRAPATFLSTG